MQKHITQAINVALENAPLGKPVAYQTHYQAELLHVIPRAIQRNTLIHAASHDAVGDAPIQPSAMFGVDVWNAYEFSWLNPKHKPNVAIVQFHIDAASTHMVESKSFKLYLNAFHQTVFENIEEIKKILCRDISAATGAYAAVHILPANQFMQYAGTKCLQDFTGYCLDQLDIDVDLTAVISEETAKRYLNHTINHTMDDIANVANHLSPSKKWVTNEIVYSNLLKSNCLVTNQPDWGSVQITYTGYQIKHDDLLRYLISFRQHQEFHEHCVERIFSDIMHHLAPSELSVYAKYTRRGGLDINPFRSNTSQHLPKFVRHARQ